MKNRVRNWAAPLLLSMLLGIHGENLALWVGDDPQPAVIFNCRADQLPPADQILLRRGIPVDTAAELVRALENYL